MLIRRPGRDVAEAGLRGGMRDDVDGEGDAAVGQRLTSLTVSDTPSSAIEPLAAI